MKMKSLFVFSILFFTLFVKSSVFSNQNLKPVFKNISNGSVLQKIYTGINPTDYRYYILWENADEEISKVKLYIYDLTLNDSTIIELENDIEEYVFEIEDINFKRYKVKVENYLSFLDTVVFSEEVTFRTEAKKPNAGFLRVDNLLPNTTIDSVSYFSIIVDKEHSDPSYTFSHNVTIKEIEDLNEYKIDEFKTDSTFVFKPEKNKIYGISIKRENEVGATYFYSEFSSHNDLPLLPAPKQIFPTDNSYVYDNKLLIAWEDKGVKAEYSLEITKKPRVKEDIHSKSMGFIGMSAYSGYYHDGFNGNYFWRVKYIDKTKGISNFSPYAKSKLVLLSIENTENQVLLLQNPVTDKLVLNQEYKYYRIFDISGLLLKEGQSVSEIDVTSIPSGIYILNLDDKVSKFVISR